MQSAWSRLFVQKITERRFALMEGLLITLDARTAGMINGLDEALEIAGRVDGILSGELSADS